MKNASKSQTLNIRDIWLILLVAVLFFGCSPYYSKKRVTISGDDVRSFYGSGNVAIDYSVERKWGK